MDWGMLIIQILISLELYKEIRYYFKKTLVVLQKLKNAKITI